MSKKLHLKQKPKFTLQDRYQFQGLPISVENKAGTYRTGTDRDGHKWKTYMRHDYGYIRSTAGADNEGIDVYVGSDRKAPHVYVVKQHDIAAVKDWGGENCPDCGEHAHDCACEKYFDEDKVMLGFPSKEAARDAYMKQYDSPMFLGPISVFTVDKFKDLIQNGKKRDHKDIPIQAVRRGVMEDAGDDYESAIRKAATMEALVREFEKFINSMEVKTVEDIPLESLKPTKKGPWGNRISTDPRPSVSKKFLYRSGDEEKDILFSSGYKDWSTHTVAIRYKGEMPSDYAFDNYLFHYAALDSGYKKTQVKSGEWIMVKDGKALTRKGAEQLSKNYILDRKTNKITKRSEAEKSEFLTEGVYTPTEEAAQKDPAAENLKTIESLEKIGGSIVANALPKAWRANKPGALLGQKVENTRDLAVLAQVYRNPSFETFRIFFLNDDGVVVHQTALSSRRVGSSGIVPEGSTLGEFIEELKESMWKSGATGYYLLHNHPSGKARSSKQDILATNYFASELGGFKGHVIVDHGTYCIIHPDLSVTEEDDIEKSGYDPDGEPVIAHPMIGVTLMSPDHVLPYLSSLKKTGSFQIIGRRSSGTVGCICDIPNSVIGEVNGRKRVKDPEQLGDVFRKASLTSGSARFLLVNVSVEIRNALLDFNAEGNYVEDIILNDGQSVASMKNMWVYFPREASTMFLGEPVTGEGMKVDDTDTKGTVFEDVGADPSNFKAVIQSASGIDAFESIFRAIFGKSAVAPVENGKESTTYLPDNTPVDFGYKIVEADDLITSHTDEMNINPEFPQERQPRQRDRAGLKLQVDEMANKLNPARLSGSPSATSGSPIVDRNLVVESGNGRTIAIRKAYKKGAKGAEYKAWLAENADKFGFTAEQVERFRKPVLIRMRQDTDMSPEEFARKANQGETAQMSPAELARADSERISVSDLSMLKPTLDGYLGGRDNQPFINRFLEKVGISESAGYLTESGSYTRQLLERIQGAIFYKAYQDDTLLNMMIEEADPKIRNVISALTVSASEFAKCKAIDPAMGGMNLPDHIVAAAKLIKASRESGTNLETMLVQSKMFKGQEQFHDEIPPEVAHIARFLNDKKNIRSAKRLGLVFQNSAVKVKDILGRANQMNLLGDPPPQQTSSEIVDLAIEKMKSAVGEVDTKQKGLFASAKTDRFPADREDKFRTVLNILKESIKKANESGRPGKEPPLVWPNDGEDEGDTVMEAVLRPNEQLSVDFSSEKGNKQLSDLYRRLIEIDGKLIQAMG